MNCVTPNFIGSVVVALIFGGVIGLPFGLVGTLVGGLIVGGLAPSEIDTKAIPNQGILYSARNFVDVGVRLWSGVSLLSGLILILAIGTFFGSAMGLADGELKLAFKPTSGYTIALMYAAMGGLIVGVNGGLIFGGRAVIKHLALRLVITHQGHIPLNYRRFLDHATERILMRKVGGGYIFIHRLLQDHLASLSSSLVEEPHTKKKKALTRRSIPVGCGCSIFLVVVMGLCSLGLGLFIADYNIVRDPGSPTPYVDQCTIEIDGCAILFDSPYTTSIAERRQEANNLPCLPHGTEIQVIERIGRRWTENFSRTNYYHISSYHFDGGPITLTSISPGSPAEEVGLQPGDILLKIDDVPIRNNYELKMAIQEHSDQTVNLLIQRNGVEVVVNVFVRASPPRGQGAIGFSYEGGVLEGGDGYVMSPAVLCNTQTENP